MNYLHTTNCNNENVGLVYALQPQLWSNSLQLNWLLIDGSAVPVPQ
jgi:hypothetical protein